MTRPSREPPAAGRSDPAALWDRYRRVRETTIALCAPLAVEDYVIQSMPDASPANWHLAHTSWFFERFVLGQLSPEPRRFHPRYEYLFNSYYESVGERQARPRRGLCSRPTVAEVRAYREHVDRQIGELCQSTRLTPELGARLEIGLHHEQQHQELLLTDLLHLFAQNPLRPAYRAPRATTGEASQAALGDRPIAPAASQMSTARYRGQVPPLRWLDLDAGLAAIGHDGPGFAFDNERPRHRVYLPGCELASRLVTNGEYLEFIADRGYARPELWLSDGWDLVQAGVLEGPLYWEREDGGAAAGRERIAAEAHGWLEMTLDGLVPLDPAAPVCHLSYYEADAYARWAGARLPTEAEWEVAATRLGPSISSGGFLESGALHPRPLELAADHAEAMAAAPAQLVGEVWQWTQSDYAPYPGFRPFAGSLGEYNGKFMSGKRVLRGGSVATPASHFRLTYRNFFPPDARWQFSGVRLARDRAP